MACNNFYTEETQANLPPSEQQVPEPKKYTGSAIPSRSFRILQAMTASENNGKYARLKHLSFTKLSYFLNIFENIIGIPQIVSFCIFIHFLPTRSRSKVSIFEKYLTLFHNILCDI